MHQTNNKTVKGNVIPDLTGKGKAMPVQPKTFWNVLLFLVGSCLTMLPSIRIFGQNPGDAPGNPASELSRGGYRLSPADTAKRKAYLKDILRLLPEDNLSEGRVSYLDATFKDWLDRTGELPPDFDRMPSVPFLPNLLMLDENGKSVPIKTNAQWQQKRKWMMQALQYYITGTVPPTPDNMQAKIISEKKEGAVTLQTVALSFGPEHRAKLTLELMIPPGNGPFPVFLSQWYHRGWAQIAVRRGYVGCVYTGADGDDDTEAYAEIWGHQYDFTRLMRRAFGASRAIDYLHTLPFIDKEKIGLTGHSRNGKTSLWAAAFDERIKAVVSSSGGSGGEVPWRYTSHKYDTEDIALLSCNQPPWLHPRLRFFIGRENKLPVDQHHFMALVAPRGLMLSAAINETETNPWGIEQAYHATRKVYRFLGAENNLSIRLRTGLHGTRANDIESYIDFFDYIFQRSEHRTANELLFDYSFDQWLKLSREHINPLDFPVKKPEDITTGLNHQKISTTQAWETKKQSVQQHLRWILGEAPPGVGTQGPQSWKNSGSGEGYFGYFIERPEKTEKMSVMAVSPYHTFGDYLYGYLYFPKKMEEAVKKGTARLPVVVYLHEYDYSKGFSSEGFDHDIQSYFEALTENGLAVFAYDMVGFGNRMEEGSAFYRRYPNWSKMGKCVADLQGAIATLARLNFIDSTRISVVGYSLGATVALYTAALDKRIAAVGSVGGFTPMRTDTLGSGREGIAAYSHLHGMIPRLGFFLHQESRIPYDFHEVLAAIAPRPVLVIAPVLDQDASLTDIQTCVQQAGKIYQLYHQPKNIQLYTPNDYNRFSNEMRKRTIDWLHSVYK